MVKLTFNPKDKSVAAEPIESNISKKREINFNPFSEEQQNFNQDIKSIEQTLTVKSLIGLENCAYVLNEWYTKNNPKLLLIMGPTGCGKTTLVELYCKENSIQLYTVRSSEKTKKEILKEIVSFAEYNTGFFIKGENKKLLLIDEYQNNQNDVFSLTDIHNLSLLRNENLKDTDKKDAISFLHGITDTLIVLPPILIISSDPKGSKLSDIKKVHETFYINEINVQPLKTWIKSIGTDLHENQLVELITKCKSDKRLLLNTLEFLKSNKNKDLDSFIQGFYKDSDNNMFEFIHQLFDNLEPIDINDIYRIYDTDGFLLSNLVHENYIDYNQDIHAAAKSADSISMGETIFSDTYESNKKFIPDAHCLNSICIPSIYSRDDKPNKNIRTCCINNRYNIYLNNNKIINKINNGNVNGLNIYDIFYIKTFLNQSLIKSKTLNEHQEKFLTNIMGSLRHPERLELLYKHFSDFSGKELKTKNFTLKFKEKLKNLIKEK